LDRYALTRHFQGRLRDHTRPLPTAAPGAPGTDRNRQRPANSAGRGRGGLRRP
jgi:hypothetical protein